MTEKSSTTIEKPAKQADKTEPDQVPAPEQPTEVEIDPGDAGVTAMPLVVRDADVDAESTLTPDPKDALPYVGEQVESLEAAANTNGVIVSINGVGYLFNGQMTAALKQIVDKAIVGLGALMPTVTETTVEAYAACHDGRCAGYKQQPVRGVVTTTEFSYVDFGGDVPGIERSSTLIRFADPDDEPCPVCGEPRFVADQVRPIYPNVSGRPQDALLHINDSNERVRDVELADARREAEVAQMRALMERQAGQIDRLTRDLESRPRGPGRPRKETAE